MQEITGYSMKNTGLGWKIFNSLGTEENEPSYTSGDKFMRWFVDRVLREDA